MGKNKGKAKKRNRNPSDQKASPTQIQTIKKVKLLELQDGSDTDSVYQDAEDSAIDEIEPPVNEKKMASTDHVNNDDHVNIDRVDSIPANLCNTLSGAIDNPDVVDRILSLIKTEIRTSIRQEIDVLKNELKERDYRISVLERKIEEKDSNIKILEEKIEGLEMYGRRNGVRIFGVPEGNGENTDEIVFSLANDMKVNIPPHALGRSHRVGKKIEGKPRAIIAKFVGHNFKVAFMKGKKLLREKQNRNNVYVNEDLTRKRYGWFMKVRGLKNQGKIRSCWTIDGVLFVKFTDSKDEKPERIDSDTEMTTFLASRSLADVVEVPTRSDALHMSVFSTSTDVDE